MIQRAVIIPTGDEVKDGTIIDTDSPMIREALQRLHPECSIEIAEAIADEPGLIQERIMTAVNLAADLIVLIGGSGGGHRHNPSLSKDFTHSVLDELLPDAPSGSLYGKNGHLWCRLVCGQIGQTMIINVPGPFVEARAAMEAFAASYKITPDDFKAHNQQMLQAVSRQYGTSV